jgi:hypothetical protein
MTLKNTKTKYLIYFLPILFALYFPAASVPGIKIYGPYFLAIGIISSMIPYITDVRIRLKIVFFFLFTVAIVILSAFNSQDLYKISIIKELFRSLSLLFWIQYSIFVGNHLKLKNGIYVARRISSYFVILNFFVVTSQFAGLGIFDVYKQGFQDVASLNFRAAGLLCNPNLSAFVTSLLLLFCLDEKAKLKSFMLIIFAVLTVLLLQSRSGIIVVLLSILLYYSFVSSGRKVFIFILILMGTVLFSFFMLDLNFTRLAYLADAFSKLSDISEINSVATRFQIIQNFWSQTPSYPSFFGYLLNPDMEIMDNEYIYIYSHRGIIGILTLLGIIYYSFKLVKNKMPSLTPILACYFFLYAVLSVQAETFSSLMHALFFSFPVFVAFSTKLEKSNYPQP